MEKLERTMDAIRAKYGHDSLTTAVTANPPEEPEDGVPF